MTQFQIRKDSFAQQRLLKSDKEEGTGTLAAGEIRVDIERFALTANNITYAAMGDMLGYWQFFPPIGDDAEGWGVIPVWGFAKVSASNVEEFPIGERIYGYFPPAEQLTMKPQKVAAERFVDGAEHRSQLPPGYNMYRRMNPELAQDVRVDNERMLLSPLFVTSYCLWDSLQDSQWYGAEQVIVLSASSKTSIGLAYALHDDPAAPHSIGVTSARNLTQVEALKLYDSCMTYDALSDIDRGKATVIVDMSGNREVLAKLHQHLGDNMKHTINVGLTHWDNGDAGEGIIADRSEFFFAPGHIQKRIKEWGIKEFDLRSSTFVNESAVRSRDWLELKTVEGLDALPECYADVCAGRVAPNEGIIIEL